MSSYSAAAPHRRWVATPLAMLTATASGASVSSIVNLLLALGGHAAGAAASFQALQVATFVPLTVIGTVAGVVGWTVIRARSTRPAAVLRWLVPVVLLLSFVPDILVGATAALPGTSWTGVVALMLMHVSVTAAAVLSLRVLLPVGRATS